MFTRGTMLNYPASSSTDFPDRHCCEALPAPIGHTQVTTYLDFLPVGCSMMRVLYLDTGIAKCMCVSGRITSHIKPTYGTNRLAGHMGQSAGVVSVANLNCNAFRSSWHFREYCFAWGQHVGIQPRLQQGVGRCRSRGRWQAQHLFANASFARMVAVPTKLKTGQLPTARQLREPSDRCPRAHRQAA